MKKTTVKARTAKSSYTVEFGVWDDGDVVVTTRHKSDGLCSVALVRAKEWRRVARRIADIQERDAEDLRSA